MKEAIFPLSNQSGANYSHINKAAMLQMALKSIPLSQQELNQVVTKHMEFLMSGGAGGQWNSIDINGIVMGVYTGVQSEEGQQASFEHRQLSAHCSFEGVELPFSNFCGTYGESIRFESIDLSYALLTDARLSKCNFNQSILCNIDFSRADLSYSTFRGADLSNSDFENTNLEGADFTGAILKNTRFPGANLTDVKF